MLQFSTKDNKVIQEVPLTTDHFQPLFDAEWLKGIDRNEELTATVSKQCSHFQLYMEYARSQ